MKHTPTFLEFQKLLIKAKPHRRGFRRLNVRKYCKLCNKIVSCSYTFWMNPHIRCDSCQLSLGKYLKKEHPIT